LTYHPATVSFPTSAVICVLISNDSAQDLLSSGYS